MPKYIVDIGLDGYDSKEEMEKACEEFIYENLNFSGSYVDISKISDDKKLSIDEILNELYKHTTALSEHRHTTKLDEAIQILKQYKEDGY